MFEKSFLAFHFREMMEYDFNENEQSVYRLKKEERRGKKKNSRTRTISFETSGGKTAVKILEKLKREGGKRENRAERARTLLTRNFLPEGRTGENFLTAAKFLYR